MNNKIKKINFNHSFIFFLFCNIISLIIFKIKSFTISPLICLLLILSIGVSHGSLDNSKGRKLFQIFEIKNFFIFYLSYISIALLMIILWITQKPKMIWKAWVFFKKALNQYHYMWTLVSILVK